MRSALELYERALAAEEAPQSATARVRHCDGTLTPLPVHLYLASADDHDHRLVTDLDGPVLDVGCGPGRYLHALAAAGIFALGVDISPTAVALARRGGGHALVADVFDSFPRAGQWASILLMDGNIGIGGQPDRLLLRLAGLIRPGGVILVELEAPGRESTSRQARLEAGAEVSGWFAWARVSAAEIGSLAACVGLTVEATWPNNGRWFARLRTAGPR